MLEEIGLFYFRQGLFYLKNKRVTPAVEALEKAAALRERDFEILNILGLCYYTLGDFCNSREVWEKSLMQSPEDNLASRYLQDLQGEDFSYLLQKYNEALRLAQSGKYKQAESILLQMDTFCFSFVSFTNLLGLCFLARGKKIKALSAWLRALSLDQENPLTIKYLIQGFNNTRIRKKGLKMRFKKIFGRKA